MLVSRSSIVIALVSVAVASFLACDDATAPPAHGGIRVAVQPAGEDVVVSGLRASIENGPVQTVDPLALEALFLRLSEGTHLVRLEGMSSNCQVAGANPRPVEVIRQQSTRVEFALMCTARVGSVRVRTTTTGTDLDPDGYTAVVIEGPSVEVGVNASVTIPGVRAGQRLVTLSGVAPNCNIEGADTVGVAVPADATVDAAFALTCADFGTLTISTTMSGDDPDPDGYRVTATGIVSHSAAAAPRETISMQLPPGDYQIRLDGLTVNCDAMPAAARVIVPSGSTVAVSFDIRCATAMILAFVSIDPYCYYYYTCGSFYDIYTIKSNGTALTRLTSADGYDAAPAWSADGQRLAFSSPRSGSAAVHVMNSDGSDQASLTTTLSLTPSWSPSGKRIAFTSMVDGNFDVYVMDDDGANVVRLTSDPGVDADPTWSPSGTHIAFSSTRDGDKEIYLMNADGSGLQQLTHNNVDDFHPAWSTDGSRIAFVRGQGGCFTGACLPSFSLDNDLWVMNADGSNAARLLASGAQAGISYPSWSPDGRWIAFQWIDCTYVGYGSCYSWTPSIKAITLDAGRLEHITSVGSDPAWRP